jgi:CBS domain-containing protein
MLRLRDIMTTNVLTVSPDAPLGEVAELLARNRVTGIPVVAGRKVVGVVTSGDLLAFLGSTSPRVEVEAEEDAPPGDMAELDDDSDEAALYFTDLWREDESDLSERFERTAGSARDPFGDHVVADAMTPTRHVLGPSAPVRAAADLMRRTGEHRVLVMKDRALLGIVTTSDIVRAVGEGRLGPTRTVVAPNKEAIWPR